MKQDSFVWNLEIKRIFAVIFFTFVYAVGVLWFIEASVVPMYTGGVLGIAQLFRDTLFVVFDQTTGIAFLATVNMMLNIPILILGWKGVSHRFTIYTLISIVFQTLFLSLIPRVDFGLSEQVHVFAASTLGGLLIGIGAGGALRYGASTGGIDIIAQYVS
ncbi:MAG: YitT family protein, partial [Acholeplasmataceae bacterium]